MLSFLLFFKCSLLILKCIIFHVRTWEYKWPLAQTGHILSECAYFISVLPMKHFPFAHKCTIYNIYIHIIYIYNIYIPFVHNRLSHVLFLHLFSLGRLIECLCFTLYHFKGIVLSGPISTNSCRWPFYLFYCHFTVNLVTACFGCFWFDSSLFVYYT